MKKILMNLPKTKEDVVHFVDDVMSAENGECVIQLVDGGMPICGMPKDGFRSGSTVDMILLGYYIGTRVQS